MRIYIYTCEHKKSHLRVLKSKTANFCLTCISISKIVGVEAGYGVVSDREKKEKEWVRKMVEGIVVMQEGV